jgi:hypothetical protein
MAAFVGGVLAGSDQQEQYVDLGPSDDIDVGLDVVCRIEIEN